jgi:hypothetical protein
MLRRLQEAGGKLLWWELNENQKKVEMLRTRGLIRWAGPQFQHAQITVNGIALIEAEPHD